MADSSGRAQGNHSIGVALVRRAAVVQIGLVHDVVGSVAWAGGLKGDEKTAISKIRRYENLLYLTSHL